ncbi:hypothetical protein BX666DRAFT_1913793 [Dichotomocladium elegans]|nr:hypothetical protein BX666DRAFT_1913793 [Dichotomocladium elegans]
MSNSNNLPVSRPQEAYIADEVDWPLGSQRIHITLVVLRLCTFVLDELLSCYSVYPFISPVPAAAVLYHAEIDHPMDFSTLESNLYREKYKTFCDFEQDLELIWRNAKQFHNPVATIYKLAVNLEEKFSGLLLRIRREGNPMPIPDPSVVPVPEETDFSQAIFNEAHYTTESVLYFLQIVLPSEKGSKAIRGFSKVRTLYDQLNEPFLRVIEAMKQGGPTSYRPLPRLYIGKNRTLLAEAQRVPHATVAILMNVQVVPYKHDKRNDLFHVSADVALVRPIGECHEFDATGVDTSLSTDFLPKAYIKVKVVRVVTGVQAIITDAMEKLFFRRAYTTHRLSRYHLPDLKKVRDTEIAKLFSQAIIDGQTGLLPADSYYTTSAAAMDTASSDLGSFTSNPAIKRNATSIPATATTATSDAALLNPKKRDSPQVASDTLVNEQNNGVKRSKHTHSPDSGLNSMRIPSLLRDGSSKETHTNLTSTYNHKTTDSPMAIDNDKIAYTKYLGPDDETARELQNENDGRREYYLEKSRELWQNVFTFCKQRNVPVVHVNKYLSNTSSFPNAEGFFKHVYYVHNNSDIVVQTFRRMTITQRATELVSLLTLQGKSNMGQIVEVLQEDGGEIIGLAMKRYQKTLKQYTHKHTHHRLTAYQKMDLIKQMLRCMKLIHEVGIAHRDLSEVNFMVDEKPGETLPDGSAHAHVYLIDFGKAIFTHADDLRRWWVDKPKVQGEYEGEVLPESKAELEEWCMHMPWIKSKPDHGYRHYRSIQTLPRARADNDVLPYLINPIAEDMYSIGTLIWKIFSETEPWHGILDTDLKGLRDTVKSDYAIDNTLEREVSGELSRRLLRSCLRVNPDDRLSAAEILEWLDRPEIYQGLIAEWTEFAPVSRTKRHAKAAYRFEEEQSREQRLRKSSGAGRSRKRRSRLGSQSSTSPDNNNTDDGNGPSSAVLLP